MNIYRPLKPEVVGHCGSVVAFSFGDGGIMKVDTNRKKVIIIGGRDITLNQEKELLRRAKKKVMDSRQECLLL
jgi:hypothetical protein